jgi:hypothetical protein
MNTSRTIEQLEATVWPEPPADATGLVLKCYALRQVPIERLGRADLRVLIGQNIALKYLMPLALRVLEQQPMLESEYYPGDLLVAAMAVDRTFWKSSPKELAALTQLALQAQSFIAGAGEAAAQFRQVAKDVARFNAQGAA